MGKFDRKDKKFGNDRSNDRGDRGDRGGRFDRNDRDDRNSRGSGMHQAVCADCGKRCEVPFKPTGDRPVYCSDCFGKQSGGNSSRSARPERRSFDRPSYGDRPSYSDRPKFEAVCAKCGKYCEVPFKPTGEKPVYCSDCFDKGGSVDKGRGAGVSSMSSDQLASINAKLDRILAAISSKTLVVTMPSEKAENKSDKKVKEEKEELIKPKKAVKAKATEKAKTEKKKATKKK